MDNLSPVLDYSRSGRHWSPPANLTDHSGNTIRQDIEFFQAPPPEIGDIISADSTLAHGTQPMGEAIRSLIVFLAAMPGAAIILCSALQLTGATIFWVVVGAAMIIAGPVIAIIQTTAAYTCSYVGTNGIARFSLRNRVPDDPPESECFLFSQASDLYTSETRRYYKARYYSTSYSFTWLKDGRTVIHNIEGKHASKHGSPHQGDAYYYARAAEQQWTKRLLGPAQAQLDAKGYIQFCAGNGGEVVRIGKAFLEFVYLDGCHRIEVHEIDSFSVADGRIKVVRRDATSFKRNGKFAIEVDSLESARLFLVEVQALLGIPCATWPVGADNRFDPPLANQR